jgi:DNA-binding CsgD family transcriptional regulator
MGNSPYFDSPSFCAPEANPILYADRTPMSLELSSSEIRGLEVALKTLASPFHFSGVSEWRAASRHAVATLVKADKSGSLYPFGDDALVQVAPEDTWAAEAYAAHYHAQDTGWLQRRRELGLEVAHWSQVYDMRTLSRTEIYNDWSKPAGFLDAISLTVDFPESPMPAGMLFYHSREGGPEFGERGLTLLRMLHPAFKAGVSACRQLARVRNALSLMVDQAGGAMFIIDREGRVLHENNAMGRLLTSEPEAVRVRGEASRLGRSLAARLAPRKASAPPAVPNVFTRELRTSLGCYSLRAIFLPEGLFDRSETIGVTIEGLRSSRVHDDGRERYGLTRREAEVARLLARGLSNRALAAELGISAHTAMRHTERVLEKLHVHSRAAVAAELYGMSDQST